MGALLVVPSPPLPRTLWPTWTTRSTHPASEAAPGGTGGSCGPWCVAVGAARGGAGPVHVRCMGTATRMEA